MFKLTKLELYQYGVAKSKVFLDKNNLPHPIFMTYEYALSIPEGNNPALKMLRKVFEGPSIGTGTGLYCYGHVFVNLDRAAHPVQVPRYQTWSWPGWKTDRTPVGVVAHETGHYVEHILQQKGILTQEHGKKWRDLVATFIKPATSYEPVASEAWAETMRLFILNPDLLRRAIDVRYNFIIDEAKLKPSEDRDYKDVLENVLYFKPAERWIAAKYQKPRKKKHNIPPAVFN